jgi:hypothetical protein
VEHVGPAAVDAAFFFSSNSLVKNFTVEDHAGELPAALTSYAEPIINYVLSTRQNERTGRERAPVAVYTMNQGSPVGWKVGKLRSALTCCAYQCNGGQIWQHRPNKSFSVADQRSPGWLSELYVLRGRRLDNFFCMQEFGFHVLDQRGST